MSLRRLCPCAVGAALASLALAMGGYLPPAAHAAAGGAAFIRVDLLGYSTTGPKRAYLMSRRDQTGATFTVRSPTGATVLSAGVGPSLGPWSGRFDHVYALDFDALHAPGTYTLSLDVRAPVSSPPFDVSSPQTLYQAPLANALSFYEDERDGPALIPSALRSAPAHLNDETAMAYASPKVNAEGELLQEPASLGERIDASGGWWDAGDYLKFVQTTSYAVALQLIGVRDFPAAMGVDTGRSNFTEEARFGVEWLLRMWDDATRTLYYQVGIGAGNADTAGDHDIWRLPQADDTYGGRNPRFRFIRQRPVFRAAPPGSPVSPNLAGRDAAAFALCFQAFARIRPELASRCLFAGEHIFELADTDPRGVLLTTLPHDFYPETEWRDDLELGATELARALSSGVALPPGLRREQSRFYLEAAARWAHAYMLHAGAAAGEGVNLYDVSGLAHPELVRALRASGGADGLQVSEGQLIADLGGQLQAAAAQSRRDPFGFGFPWDAADTASHGDGLSVMASEYDSLTDQTTYRDLAVRWLGNVLGANAWGSSFIIGDGSTFPECPQHQLANIVGSHDGSPPVLAGAVVEGPSDERSRGKVSGMRPCPSAGGNAFARFDNRATYKDAVQSFTTTEPAIDLTASSMLAFSWQAGS